MQDREEPDILEELVNRSNLFCVLSFYLCLDSNLNHHPRRCTLDLLDQASALVHLVTFDMYLISSDLCFRLASIHGPSSRRPMNLAS